MDKRVLLVDDEKAPLEVLCKALDKDGWQSECAVKPSEALEIFEAFGPHVVITDLALNNHIDGATMASRMHMQDPMAVFLCVTGLLSNFNLGYLLGAIFTDVFLKPVSIKEIRKAANYAFEKRQRWESYL